MFSHNGQLLDAARAAQCGLVDELVDDSAALLAAAEREAAERLTVPESAREDGQPIRMRTLADSGVRLRADGRTAGRVLWSGGRRQMRE